MADSDVYSDLDQATLEAKLAEAETYEERSALRKELRARKKQSGDSAAGAARKGTPGYNRFRTSITPSKKQHYIPAVAAGGAGGRQSPSVTPVRSNTPSSTASPTPLSPAPSSTSPVSPPSPIPKTPSPLPPEPEPIVEETIEDQKEEEEEEEEEEEDDTAPDDEPLPPPPPPAAAAEQVYKDKELERETQVQAQPATRSQEQVDAGSPFKVQLRSRGGGPAKTTTPSPKKTDTSKAEFQGFKLRKTPSQSKGDDKPAATTATTKPAATTATTNSPRTLADYQRVTNKPKTTSTAEKISYPKEHEYLVNYVNATLLLAVSPDGSELYDACCNPTMICKLINKSVRNTVDMRALTKTPPPSKAAAREEALSENMTLAVESARAIGCAVVDDTEEKLLNKDDVVFRQLLIDLMRARLVNRPGMEDAPSSLFNNLSKMMEKLGLSSSVDAVDGGEEEEEPRRWREVDNDTLRKEVERDDSTATAPPPSSTDSWRENPEPKPAVDLNKSSMNDELSYEERAALRRAEREKRRREREALATAK